MHYEKVKNLIYSELKKNPSGLTWKEIKDLTGLPYKTFCPEWTIQLEQEIGLIRTKGKSRALVWTIKDHINE